MSLYEKARALYEGAFAGEDAQFTDALFDAYFPQALRVVIENGQPVSMLFSIPYPVVIAGKPQTAHYLYGVATDPAHRGKGHARALIAAEAARYPVFLRPMSESLFDFYARAGMKPFSPITVTHGDAAASAALPTPRALTPAAYLALRDELAPMPHCRMTEAFLRVAVTTGGTVGLGADCAALYDRVGDTVIFKEWWGNADFAPHMAAYLGAARYELRRFCADGVPFGVMSGLPQETLFLAAMD